MVSRGYPAAIRSSRKGPCKFEKTGNSRSRSLPMQVSIMMRSSPERTTKHWKEIFIVPSGVMKFGASQLWRSAISGVRSFDSMVKGSWCALISTMRTTSTPPICHFLVCSTAMALLSRSGLLRQVHRRRRCLAEDHISRLLRHHHHGRVGVPAHELRENRRIRHAQAFDSPHLQLRRYHSIFIGTHAAGAGQMMHGDGRGANIPFEFIVRLDWIAR